MRDEIGFFRCERTGEYHGALWRNVPTPGGCARMVRREVTVTGYDRPSLAVASMAALFPDAWRPTDESLVPGDTAARAKVPKGAMVTRIVPRRGGEEEGYPAFESSPGRRIPRLDERLFQMLLALGRLVPESTSGDDPDLHYRYDHYVGAGP